MIVFDNVDFKSSLLFICGGGILTIIRNVFFLI